MAEGARAGTPYTDLATLRARERQTLRRKFVLRCLQEIREGDMLSKEFIKEYTNLKLSNMVDHARSDVPKAAVSRLRADSARENDESAIHSAPLGCCLATLHEVSSGRVKLKFGICYTTMTKQSLPFAKYPA